MRRIESVAARQRAKVVLTDAVCGVTDVHGLIILHGMQDQGGGGNLRWLDWHLPRESTLYHERELTAATLGQGGAQAQRLMAEAAGVAVPTGAALLTGALLDVRTLDHPLVDAEMAENKRLDALLKLPTVLRERLKAAEVGQQHARIAQAEQQILAYTAEIMRLRAKLLALDTPEAERERDEARARL